MNDLPAGLSREELVALLLAAGAGEDEVAAAEADGTLLLLAIDRLTLGQDLVFDIDDACARTGLPGDELRHIWRSLGFPDPQPGERVFSEVDLANFTAVAGLLHSGAATSEVIYGMTRVVGSSMARIASALVDTVSTRAEELTSDAEAELPYGELASESGGFLPMFPRVLEQVWRRHLQVAARRRLLRTEHEGTPGAVVGFADLVGFTAMSQQVSDEELAVVVDQFEHLAYDVVVAGSGRVVKMIGDEVMFLVDDAASAVEIALGLAEASRDATELSDVRVGLALGPVLEREGDVFGPTVNLASRITAIAYPGSVVVSAELRAALEDEPGFAFRTMRPRFLKHIGRVSLSAVRRSEDAPTTVRAALEERRQRIREAVKERVTSRLPGLADLTAADDPAAPE